MKAESFFFRFSLAATVLTIGACNSTEQGAKDFVPNHENCSSESLKKIPDDRDRWKMADKCALKSTVKPSKPTGW